MGLGDVHELSPEASPLLGRTDHEGAQNRGIEGHLDGHVALNVSESLDHPAFGAFEALRGELHRCKEPGYFGQVFKRAFSEGHAISLKGSAGTHGVASLGFDSGMKAAGMRPLGGLRWRPPRSPPDGSEHGAGSNRQDLVVANF